MRHEASPRALEFQDPGSPHTRQGRRHRPRRTRSGKSAPSREAPIPPETRAIAWRFRQSTPRRRPRPCHRARSTPLTRQKTIALPSSRPRPGPGHRLRAALRSPLSQAQERTTPSASTRRTQGCSSPALKRRVAFCASFASRIPSRPCQVLRPSRRDKPRSMAGRILPTCANRKPVKHFIASRISLAKTSPPPIQIGNSPSPT